MRWGIVEEVYKDDIVQPSIQGASAQDAPVVYARSVKVRWLHHGGGRAAVRFVEPCGVTSVPLIGSVVAVGFMGGPGGEPIVLGFWTQGYNDRIPGELGDLSPGQEVWRRSGLRFRVIPHYTDLREFPKQHDTSPWTIDLIMGEQHDQACFCVICQTRYPSEKTLDADGKITLVCPTRCPDCGGPMTLVKGSVATGEGDEWLAVQAQLLVDTTMNGIFEFADEHVIVEITDVATQRAVRDMFRTYVRSVVGPTWSKEVVSYYESELLKRWESMLREYFSLGNLLTYADDASGLIDSTLVQTLVFTVDRYIQAEVFHYLTNRVSDEERKYIEKELKENLKTYITNDVYNNILLSASRFIQNKARIYIAETIARLRRKATSWLYKEVLRKAKKAAVDAFKSRLDLDFGGLREVRDDAANLSVDILETIAEADLAKRMQELLDEGVKDPEPLPIFELRLDQDLKAIINDKTGREEGQGQKAARFRLKIYRDGEMRLQIQENTFMVFGADGSIDIVCEGPITIDAPALAAAFEDDSYIHALNTMHIGHPGVDMKDVTLHEDDVLEYDESGKQSTRDYIQKVAWRYIAQQLNAILSPIVPVPADGGAFVKAQTQVGLLDVLRTVVDPPDDSVIGKTKASAEHLKGN